jgi:hypothetical protein
VPPDNNVVVLTPTTSWEGDPNTPWYSPQLSEYGPDIKWSTTTVGITNVAAATTYLHTPELSRAIKDAEWPSVIKRCAGVASFHLIDPVLGLYTTGRVFGIVASLGQTRYNSPEHRRR